MFCFRLLFSLQAFSTGLFISYVYRSTAGFARTQRLANGAHQHQCAMIDAHGPECIYPSYCFLVSCTRTMDFL